MRCNGIFVPASDPQRVPITRDVFGLHINLQVDTDRASGQATAL
jgi:hypothetical protein